ncbi:MAG: hypothetical protein ACTSYI_03770 [Promethearchaeota archaeon]
MEDNIPNSGEQSEIKISNEFLLEDWRMAKDRIKHFDDVVIKLRLEAIPISGLLITLGITQQVDVLFLIAAIYLIPIFLLDIVHFTLLIKSVKYALELETKLNNQVNITTRLTRTWISVLHGLGYLIYFAIWISIYIIFK